IWSSGSCRGSVVGAGHVPYNTVTDDTVPAGAPAPSASCLSTRRRGAGGGPIGPCPRLGRCSDGFGVGLVERLLQRVPGERRALDPHRELHDALECLEIAQPYALQVGLQVAAIRLALELGLVDRHQRLERTNEPARLLERL